MKQRFLTARGGIAALLVIFLSLCLAFGAFFALSYAAYAEDDIGGLQESDGDNGEEDEWNGENDWIIKPVLVNWTEGEFDSSVNVISANPRYGADEMYFRIISYQTIGENKVLAPFYYEDGVDWNGTVDKTAFRLTGEDRSLPDYVIDVISELEAGTYYLFAVVPATEKYSGINTNVEISPATINEICTPFKVLKKTEYNKLSIKEWEWSTFDYRTNIISSDIVTDESVKVTYSVATYENVSIEGLTDFTVSEPVIEVDNEGKIEVISEGGTVNELSARVALSNLNAGKYWLIASAGGHAGEEPFKVMFTVAPYSNAWIAIPSVNEWTWGEYRLNVNTISGKAQKNDSGVVYFGIFNAENEAYSTALEKFTVGENGIVNERIAGELKDMQAGAYTLKCWIENDDPNYIDISETVAFNVNHIPNTWSISPYVLSWKYGDYDRWLNVIKSEAVLGTKTQYAIYSDADCKEAVKFNGSEWFEPDKNGLVPESVAEVLKTVNAGTYYLKCLVTNDNPNYADLSETVPFAVLKILNSWVVAPSVINWNEGHFNANENIISGSAKAGGVRFSIYDDKDKLLYIINKSEDGAITSVTNPEGESLHISILNKLTVGSYKMVAEVESSDNYTTLTTTAYFAVFEDSVALGGIIAATVTFAVIDVIAASACITLLVLRRRRVENQFRNMVRKELGRK